MRLEIINTRSELTTALSALLIIALLAIPGLAGTQEQPAFAATLENQLGLTFSPDGKTAYWVEWDGTWGSRNPGRRIIYTARQDNGSWSKPEPAPFSRRHSDDDPFVSPDGRWLYFVSDRPSDDADEERDSNIWRYSRVEKDILEYLSINSESAEYSPVVTSSGALYFASSRGGGRGAGDIYRAAALADEFAEAEILGPAINSPTGEWNVWVSADESELVFEASSRPSNASMPGDLYYSWHTPAGWTAAVPVARLNSEGSELMPRLHPDGLTLYYTTAPIGGHARIATTDWGRWKTELRAEYAPILLVANRASHEVTFVDLARGEIVARIATGEGPHLLSNVSDGRVLATGYGEFPEPHAGPVSRRPPSVEMLNSRVTLIDTENRKVILDRSIEDCAKPHASWIVAQRAYVTCETEKQLLALDLENGETVGSFETRQQGSHVLGFDPESQTLAVSNTESGSLTLINIESGTTRIVPLADGSEGLLVHADRIWVGNAWDGSVSVVDPRSASVVRQLDAVCNFPIALDSNQQAQVWVACFGSAELVAINSDTLAVERRIGLDDQLLNILLHPDRALAYVSLPRKNAIAEIELGSGRELRRIEVGIEPDGLRWATP